MHPRRPEPPRSPAKNTTPASTSAGFGNKPQFGFHDDAERALAAREQVDPIHAGREQVSGGVLGGVREWHRRNREIELVAALHVQNAAVHQRDAQAKNVFARAAVAKTARPAGIGGDGAADAGGALGGIGRIELIGARSRGLKRFERDPRAGDRAAGRDVQPLELLERYRTSRLAARCRRSVRCARRR